MDTEIEIAESELEEIPSPHLEPRIACRSQSPRQVSNNLTLIDGKTFLATTIGGDIVPAIAPDVGFFYDDTRFLSHLELCVSGTQALVLSSNTEKTFASQIELTIGSMTMRKSVSVDENTIHIRREQVLNSEVFFDRFTFLNFNLKPVEVCVELYFDADFVDVFQVRGIPRKVHGQYYRPIVRENLMMFFYRGLDGLLRQIRIEMIPKPLILEGRRARWDLELLSKNQVQIQVTVIPIVGDVTAHELKTNYAECLRERRERFVRWESESSSFHTNSGIFDAALKTAISDFHALQIREGKECVVAAGVPWFAALFGRDSIIASYQTLVLNPQLAMDTLRVHARYQGKECNKPEFWTQLDSSCELGIF